MLLQTMDAENYPEMVAQFLLYSDRIIASCDLSLKPTQVANKQIATEYLICIQQIHQGMSVVCPTHPVFYRINKAKESRNRTIAQVQTQMKKTL